MRNGMRPIHPGEVLREEFTEPFKLSASALARDLHVPPNRITGLLNETRAVTADTAMRLAHFFGTTPEFWMDLQAGYDLRVEELRSAKSIEAKITPFAETPAAKVLEGQRLARELIQRRKAADHERRQGRDTRRAKQRRSIEA
jgi:antitoxin HigA-1